MALRAGFSDQAAGAGVLEALITEIEADAQANLQAVDPMRGGRPFSLRAISGSVTPPTVTGTTPAWHAMVRKVPAGRFHVLDYATLQCSVADESWFRISRRYVLGGNVATTDPGTPTTPTTAAVTHDVGIDQANGSNTYSYRLAWVNTLGQETIRSAQSTTITPTAAQKRIDVTIGAAPAGAVFGRLYRTLAGAGAGGPWYLLDDNPGGTVFRDVHPDADLDQTRQAPAASTWAVAPTFDGPMSGPGSLIYVNTVALAAAPTHVVYTNQRGRRSSAAFAPGTAVTQLRIALDLDSRHYANLSALATHPVQGQLVPDFGASDFIGFNNTKAAMGGSWIVYGIQPIYESHFEGAIPIAGGNVYAKIDRQIPIPSDETWVVEVGGTAAQAPGVRELTVFGREFVNPT